MVQKPNRFEIPEDELIISAEPSSKPGGQHANKSSTRVILKFDVSSSRNLTEEQKQLVRERLGGRISKEGILRVTVQESRSYIANRKTAIERFMALLTGALETPPLRKKTRIPPASRRRRMEDKRKRAGLKQQRKRPLPGEE